MRKSKPKNMRDHASQLADRLAPHVESARDKAAPVIADAKVKAAPLVAEAREKTAPAFNEAKDRFTHEVLPVLTAAVAAATEATEELREEGRKRGLATAAALKGELDAPARKKKHPLRTLLVLLGLGGVAALVMKKLSDREATTAWQSSYQPTPPASTGGTAPSAVDDTPIGTAAAGTAAAGTAAAGTAAAGTADDEAASSPDEAVADAVDSPHVPSTPDNPAEEIDVDKRV